MILFFVIIIIVFVWHHVCHCVQVDDNKRFNAADDLTEVLAGELFVSGHEGASERGGLVARHIQAVMSLAPKHEAQTNFLWSLDTTDSQFVSTTIDVIDDGMHPISPLLPIIFNFLERQHRAGRAVLVHCRKGQSRSPAVVMFWLMKKKKWSLRRAFNLLKRIRPQIQPRFQLFQELIDFEVEFFGLSAPTVNHEMNYVPIVLEPPADAPTEPTALIQHFAASGGASSSSSSSSTFCDQPVHSRTWALNAELEKAARVSEGKLIAGDLVAGKYVLQAKLRLLTAVSDDSGATGQIPLLAESEHHYYLLSGKELADADGAGSATFHLENRPVSSGSMGEVWRARLLGTAAGTLDDSQHYVLKRIFLERGASPEFARMSAAREVLYGRKLRNTEYIARFVESFEVDRADHSQQRELWLVFVDEGQSLHSILFKPVAGPEGLVKLDPSQTFHWLKTEEAGQIMLRSILRGILMGVRQLHALDGGTAHRDVKPANILLNLEKLDQLDSSTFVRLCDLGSAFGPAAVEEGLYPEGPSSKEETETYQAPELVFGSANDHDHIRRGPSQDMWAVGVLFLEMVLGKQDPFQPDANNEWNRRQQRRRQPGRRSGTEEGLSLLSEFCVHEQPPPIDESDDVPDAESFCSDDHFAQLLESLDVMRIGLQSKSGRHLLRSLLQFNPENRISVQDALSHPFLNKVPVILKSQSHQNV